MAREGLPPEMNFYRAESFPVQMLMYRHRLLAASAARIVAEGYRDAETFEIATKHMNRAFMEIEDYLKAKGTSETDGAHNNDDTDGMIQRQMEKLLVIAMVLQAVVPV